MPTKRILIWTASYPPILGGLQTVTQQLARGLSNRGYHVTVLTNLYSHHLPSDEYDGSIRIIRLRHINPKPTINRFTDILRFGWAMIFFKKSQRKINQVIQNFNPDIINIHFPDNQLHYFSKITEFFIGRLVISLHGHDILRWFQTESGGIIKDELKKLNSVEEKNRRLLLNLLAAANSITACSQWLMYKTKIFNASNSTATYHITYNSIDINRFTSIINKKNNNNFQLFAAGRLDEHKGFDVLIEAIKRIKPIFPEVKLQIAGTGCSEKSLLRLITRLGLENEVQLIGRIPQEELPTKMHESSIIIIPSRRETFGIGVLEGLASGRPVVATDVGGIPEAAGGFAILVPPDALSLANAISQVLHGNTMATDPQELKAHLKLFSLQRFLDQYEDAIN
jgi:glycosyltransferase involved in cell wall biosynthesis